MADFAGLLRLQLVVQRLRIVVVDQHKRVTWRESSERSKDQLVALARNDLAYIQLSGFPPVKLLWNRRGQATFGGS